jgi:ferric-dicitrate binding protein FerR (iron transport regulator)
MDHHPLIDRYLDGLATPAEMEALGRLLASQPEMAAALAAATRTEALLEAHFCEDKAEAAVRATLAASPSPRIVSARVQGRAPARHVGWAAALLFVVAGGALVWWLVRSPAPPPEGVASRSKGSGVEGTWFSEGSRVEVAGDSAAVIPLPDGSRAELAPASAAVLRPEGSGRVVELERGLGTFHAGKGKEFLRIDTPVGTVHGNGADFSVELRPEDEEGDDSMSGRGATLLIVAVLAGQVEVEIGGQRQVLALGQSKTFAGEKPGGGKPASGKAAFGKPAFGGTVVALSANGKTLTLESSPGKKKGEPVRRDFKISEKTHLDYPGLPSDMHKPAVGYIAHVWLEEGSDDAVARVQFSMKHVILTGRVAAVSDDGATLTVELPAKSKGEGPIPTEIKLLPETKRVYKDVEGEKPVVGSWAQVWLRHGSKSTAGAVVFTAKKPEGKVKGPQPEGKVKKPVPASEQKKPDGNKKPGGGKNPAQEKKPGGDKKPTEEKKPGDGKKPPTQKKPPDENAKPQKGNAPVKEIDLTSRPPQPARDPKPLAGAIDREIDRLLAERKVPPSPPADDGEFLRRAFLDLTGRIPTYRQTVTFLADTHPDKRSRLIDSLLESSAFGEHFATVWRHLLAPPDYSAVTKGMQRDTFTPWLADQFNQGHGWDAIVRDMLTASGALKDTPQAAFLMANTESFQPRPERIAGAVASRFWAVQLRCAECHDHPFAHWKKADFWGTAAFFDRLHFTGFKGAAPSLVETTAPELLQRKGKEAPTAKQPRALVKARFLGGAEPSLPQTGAIRPTFAAWATSADNPFFARAAGNRLWAHFFGRGLSNPLDNLDGSTPSHPALLQRLAKDLADSGFELKHLARAIGNSRAYQRTSRPLPGNQADQDAFSHMALKPLAPEALYDALVVATSIDKTEAYRRAGKVKGKQSEAEPAWPTREEFARAFRGAGQGDEAPGIPQMLRLLNGPMLNAGSMLVESMADEDVGIAEGLTRLYLTVLTRKPTEEEIKLLSAYVERRKDVRAGYRGVLWVLLNSGEMALNH